jgi:glyoxylase-like metal-dependent hydrolase (beta-lactamase superfamily II)
MEIAFINSPPNRPRFNGMFGGWLIQTRPGPVFLVDCGVGGKSAVSFVQDLRKRLGEKALDYVLLTHIHLDHAGGLKEVIAAWPKVKVVVHEKAVPHLLDPARLWAGTKAALGDLAYMYGEPSPLNPASLIAHRQAEIPGLFILETPGHTATHLSYRLQDTWFLGEAGGCPYSWQGRIRTWPTVSGRYFPQAMRDTFARLLQEKQEKAYFSHSGGMFPLAASLLLVRRQLALWEEICSWPQAARRKGEDRDAYLDRLISLFLRHDLNLEPVVHRAAVIKCRWVFIRNSIRDFLRGYLIPSHPD